MADVTMFSQWCRRRLEDRGFVVSHVDWQDKYNRVSTEYGISLREVKALEATVAELRESKDSWITTAAAVQDERDYLERAMKENEGAMIALNTQISILRSQLAAEQRSNSALRGTITKMKKSREKAVREVAK